MNSSSNAQKIAEGLSPMNSFRSEYPSYPEPISYPGTFLDALGIGKCTKNVLESKIQFYEFTTDFTLPVLFGGKPDSDQKNSFPQFFLAVPNLLHFERKTLAS